MPPILEISGLTAGYGPLEVLYAVDLPIEQGRITAILGPNGAGKTTTLKVAAGLVPARRGSVKLRGEELLGSAPRSIARRGLCLIPEGRGIFPSLSVRENLKLQSKMPRAGSLKEVEEIAYARFPRLGQRRKQIAGTMSGGEQQMLALSRALTTAPDVLMIDEISMGLAPNLVEELFGVVTDLARAGGTIVLVEQLAEYTLELADHVAVMAKGRVAAFGEPDDVRDLLTDLYLGRVDGAEAAAG
ncbi:ABC transporter ATP-binding protein [Conexibacter sp. CPCC 206217]|uniref:ABC transporter ATP-binding protein n=1 Tax=Conexibacter sp. CPCC 206217 TaxID=3064574 RepID=UPI0027291497|nr:ABC transporter ATP-binding protein [Conexibacter sp. CPCC 206217]MDO8212012.1 ABC transporter ATP-binding protein [Conexibacter sp. CPCC 206217]